MLDGKDLKSIRQEDLAIQLGMLFQEGMNTMPATVFETIMLGRHPHMQSILRDDPADIEIARKAMADLELSDMADRQIGTLSGGELQRLALAMLITQQPNIYLLDEPSNHLDIAFQVKMLALLQRKMKESLNYI